MARNGASNEEIALELGGSEATVSPDNVKVMLYRARQKGFIVERAAAGVPLSPETMRVIALSAKGVGPKAIAEAVYPDRDTAKAALQVRVLRNRHKNLIEQYKKQREGTFAQGPIFYSVLKRTVEQSKQKSASAAQWKATLKAAPGVKQEEIEWTGLFDWLDSQVVAGANQPESVTREEIIAYLDANGVKVEEVAKGVRGRQMAVQDRVQELEEEFERDFYENNRFDPPYYAKAVSENWGEPDDVGRWIVAYEGMRFSNYEDSYDTEEEAQEAADAANMEAETDAFSEARSRQNFERTAEDEIGEGVQFDTYTLPGGTDYTELLLTLPDIKGPATHWDEPNVVAHVRFKTRQGANGEKVLAVEEVQSDWHQKGREQGYESPTAADDLLRAHTRQNDARHEHSQLQRRLRETLGRTERAAEFSDDATQRWAQRYIDAMERLAQEEPEDPATLERIRDLLAAERAAHLRVNETGQAVRDAEGNISGIPRAPFANNGWAALVLKRMVRWAAENGFDSIAWTPGEVQAERYDLGKVAETLYLTTLPTGLEILEVQTTDDRVLSYHLGDQKLEDYVGSDAAKKLREQEPYELKGYQDGRTRRDLDVSDLRVGEGRGMLAFYDKILVNEANKLGKKYGAQVAPFSGQTTEREDTHWHSFPITPELKAAALDGLPLFQPDNPLTPDEKNFFREEMQRLPTGETPLDVWNQLTHQQKVQFHEEFARLTEFYFMEGKAPVPKLKRMFEAFARWMKTVYQSLKDLNVEMTPEVRSILDRMYASSEDIAEATRQHALAPLFTVKPDYMTDPEWEDYQLTNANAVDVAEATLRQRSMRDRKWLSIARSKALKRLQAEAREQRKAVRAEVTAEVMAEKVNVARTFLSRGVDSRTNQPVEAAYAGFIDGELVSGPPKLSIASLEAMFPEGSGVNWKALGYGKYGMLAANGLHPDILAPILGYKSGEAMVRDIIAAEPAKEKISGLTDQRMLERYGDLVDDASIARAADEAVHNQLRARVLAGEYAAITNALGERKLILNAAQEAAKTLVLRMPAMKLSPAKFQAQERRAGRAAEEALRKNDLAGAAAAKRDQILNFYLAREVYAALKTRDQALGLFRRMLAAKRDALSKSRNFDLVQAARAVLAAHGMARMQHNVETYLDAVKRYDPNLFAALEPTIRLALSSGRKLADLTYDQFLGMRDVVDQLWTLSREEKLVEIAGQKVELQAVVNDLNLRLESLGADAAGVFTRAPSQSEKTLRLFEGAAGALRRVEAWARHMDGGVGHFTRYIWRPISQAADRYRADKAAFMQRFRALFDPVAAGLSTAKIMAPEINYTFRDKAELLHAILHTGNDSNLRKLLLGRGWGLERPDGTIDTTRWDTFLARMMREGTLTVTDYQFAQGVWDLLESTKPLAQAAHRRVFGRYFDEITARPVKTPFGEFAGGYVPAIYDAFLSPDAVLHQQQDAVESNDSTMFPSPAHGFTQSRVEYNKPLELDLRLLGQHIDKVLKFAHMAAPVRDVLRILRTPSFKALLADHHPTAQSDMLLPWLQRSARQIVEMPMTGSGGRLGSIVAREIRRRSGMGLMFMNIVNTLQQTTGFTLAALHVRKRYLALGLARYIANPNKVREAVNNLSPLMAQRGDTQSSAMFGELEQITGHRKGVTGALANASDFFARHTYFMQAAVQNVLDTAIWQGAYEQAKSKGDTEAEAVAKADAAVRLTQGSALAEDVSRWEAGNAWWRITTHMYTYFNMWGNLLSTEFRNAVRDLGLKKGAGRLFYIYVMGLTVPMIVAQIIADSLRGQLPDDDEDDGYLDDWLEYFALTNVKTAAAFVPVVGHAGVAAVNAFNDKPYDDRVGSSPAISSIESAVRTPANVYDLILDQGDASRTARDALGLLTLLTGFPFQALSRPVGYALDVEEGDVDPENEADYARGLVSGAAGQ